MSLLHNFTVLPVCTSQCVLVVLGKQKLQQGVWFVCFLNLVKHLRGEFWA